MEKCGFERFSHLSFIASAISSSLSLFFAHFMTGWLAGLAALTCSNGGIFAIKHRPTQSNAKFYHLKGTVRKTMHRLSNRTQTECLRIWNENSFPKRFPYMHPRTIHLGMPTILWHSITAPKLLYLLDKYDDSDHYGILK